MKLLRRLLFIAMGSLFRLLLFVGVSLLGIVILVGHPARIEQTLVTTDTYKEFVPAITQSISKDQQASNPIPFADKNVQKIINDAFPPSLLQSDTETVINNIYAWLQGKVPEPDFKIDFTARRQLLADNLTAYAFNRLASQPLCKTQPTSVNPFTDTCLPRYFNLDNQRATFASELNNLLPQTVFTAKDLPKASNGKTIPVAFPQIPTLYHLAVLSPWLIGSLLMLLSLAMISLTTTRRRGVRLIGSAILSSGVTLVITPLLYELVYPAIDRALSLQSHNTGINNLSGAVIQSLSHSFYNIIISLSLGVIALGICILMAERFSRGGAYADLAAKSGTVSSGSGPKQHGPDTELTADSVPIQTSEHAKGDTLAKKKRAKYRTLKKLKDKELK